MNTSANNSTGKFSLVVGGPFHTALRRLGLVGTDLLPSQRAAIGLALIAWLLPALLVVAQSLLESHYSGWGFFTDGTVYARYLVAIWVMIATERYADGRIVILTRQFREAQLLSDNGQREFTAILTSADRRSGSALAEVIILAVVLVWSGLTASFAVELAGSSWEGTVAAGEVTLSWAGEIARFISNPLFLFLVLRWIWRFLVWSVLLFRISRLPLELTPLHPDRTGGLGFLAIYPGIFSGLIFALSCVIASSILKDLSFSHHSSEAIWIVLLGWIMMCLFLFLGPMLVFVRPLYMLREQALLDYGRLAHQHHLAFHRKWIGEARNGGELIGSPEPSSVSDLNASVETVLRMRLFPVDRAAVVQLVIAAGVPMLAVVGSQVSFLELLKWVAGSIL